MNKSEGGKSMNFLKKIALISVTAGLLVGGTALAACEKSACTHEWERISTTATCEASGMLTRKCAVCGTEETVEEPALGHDMKETDEGKPATCEEAGVSVKKCSRCDKRDRKELSALGHDMKEINSTATCTEPGEVGFKCSRCDKRETQPVGALGHAWEDKQIVTEANCEHEGEKIKRCTRCETEEHETIPKTEHDLRMDFENSRSATCTKPGLEIKICKVCGESVKKTTEALGHDFNGSSKITQEATCETPGKREIACSRKDCDGDEMGRIPAVEEREIPALEHEWQTEFTYDQEPTFDEDGYRSIHCTRCDKTKDGETVKKLEEGKAVQYEFRVVRPNGETIKIGLSGITVTVKDSEGKTLATSSRDNFANGIMTVELTPERNKSFRVEVSGLPEGYRAKESYEVGPGSLVSDLVVNASLLPAPAPDQKVSYTLGSVMHDYTFKTLSGETVKLSDLLKTKKMVLFNFFFVGCSACRSEMPGLLSAYNIYKDDMAIIMLDLVDYDTPTSIREQFLDVYGVPSSVYVVQDMTPTGGDSSEYNNICVKFGFNSAPQNVVIDREGVVAYREGGSTSEMGFRQIFKRFTTAPYGFEAEEEQPSEYAPVEAILPAKRKG